MPEVAEREVVLHRIERIERAQRRGDVARHPPARAGVRRQPQAAADADHVRVERHDQLRRRHARPDAEIERVAAHHPAQKQVQPLARRPGRRARKEVADARAASARGRRRLSGRAPSRASKSCRARRRCRRRRRRSPRERTPPPIRRDRASAAAATAARRCRPRASSDGRCRRRRDRRGADRIAARRRPAPGPMTASTRSIDCSTLDTRPNASAAAMKPTISRSSSRVKRRTI